MSDLSKLRVADDEREQAIDELREHAGAGRLTSEELEDRVGGAYKASTRADLDELRADLPVSSTSVKRALVKRKSHLRRRLAQEAGGSLGVSALSVGIWLASGPPAEVLPGGGVGVTLLPVGGGAWGGAPATAIGDCPVRARPPPTLGRALARRARSSRRALPSQRAHPPVSALS